jgi:signal peptidase
LDPKYREIVKYGAAFAVLLLAFFGGSYILKGFLGTEYPMMVVVSQSMVPTLGVGDYIVVAKIPDINTMPVGSPPIGDIIVFIRPGTSDEYIVHRAIQKIDDNGSISFVTKGDNNAISDGTPVSASNVMGFVVGHIPLIGYFSLFIKTARGFGLVICFMALAFFIDYILPKKRAGAGKFPLWALTPLAAAFAIVISFWFIPDSHLALESLAIALWYLACFLLPLAFHDDDTGVMLWLYHLVLIMVPIACDVVWWTTGLTPSMWWYQSGSTVPINWLLMKEQPAFDEVFSSVLRSLIPGVVIFVVTLYAKRRGWEPFNSLHRRIRGAPPEAPKAEITTGVTEPSTPADQEPVSDPQHTLVP